MIIGLTGGIASGKSTVSGILAKLGAEVIDADKIAHQITCKGEEGYLAAVNFYGKKILKESGEIDRKFLGRIIFNDQAKRKKLESLLHPIIIKKMKEKIKEIGEEKHIVLDVPLLFETGLDRLADQVWVVYTDRGIQLERLKERDNINKKEAERRISAQMSLEKKKELADVIIKNNGSRKKLEEKIYILWREINED